MERRISSPLEMIITQGWKESLLCVNIEEIGKEKSPARVQAPPQNRRAVIRVESAETHDYVSEPQGLEEIDDEKMEDLSFIQSAVSDPRCVLFMCDNKCSKEGFKFHQIAAIVVEEEEQPTRSMDASNITL